MSKKNKKKISKKENGDTALPSYSWMGEDGMHVMVPGAQPSPEQLEEMTRMFQDSIRNSPMWGEMIKKYGAEKAEEFLKQCKANLG